MNKYKAIQVISWIIVFLVLIGMSIWFISERGSQFTSASGIENLKGPYEEKGRYSIKASDISNFDIDWTAGEVTVIIHDGDDIELIEYVQRNLKLDEKLVYSVDGKTMKVAYCKREVRFGKPLPPKKLELLIPKQLAVKIDDFKIETVSATANVSNITAKSLYTTTVSGGIYSSEINANKAIVKSTSGGIELSRLDIPEQDIKSVSGKITMKDMNINELIANTTSGAISISEVTVNNLDLAALSGSISFSGSFEKMNTNTSSGSVNISVSTVPASFYISAVSGEVRLSMPSVENFNLYKKTVSGDFDSDIPVRTQSEAEAPYIIKTTSGSIRITEIK